ncbi:MAG: VWA domain-containing protein [Luteitalea sp.]|nr:VWA domain-containing protein [Luteitalea sp.]
MRLRIRLAALFALFAGSILTAGQAPQPAPPQGNVPTPTFKAQVEYVEVDALVLDEQGNFVRDLTKDDFQVFEDGKAQTISTFALVDIPVEQAERPLFASRPIEPDVESNERPFDGRVYVLVLDDLHTDALRSQRVKAAARLFIERSLGENDLMAVLFTAGRSQDAQEFTNSKRLLLAAVDKFMGRKLVSSTLARNDEYFRSPNRGGRISDPYEQERVYNAQSMLSQLKQVAEWFGGVRGRRKTMMLISEGIDYDLSDVIRRWDAPASGASGIMDDIRETIAATARSNVSIYAIDPRGLSGGEDNITVGGFANSDAPGTSDSGASVAPPGDIGMSSLMSELRMSQDSLRQLADESGGFAVVNANDFRGAFDRVVRDNSSYYVLAYYPPTTKRDGKFHRIEVKVNRPGLRVRSRRGYASPKGNPPRPATTGGMTPELREAINSPIPISGLTLRVFAAPFKGTSPNASVLLGVELLGRDLSLATNNKVEISLLAIDTKQKVWGLRTDTLTMNLRPETRTRVEQTGFRMLNRMDLPAGRYQVRVAARDVEKTNVGSVVYDLDVPDFYKQPFGISGLTLTSMSGSAMVTAKADDQLKDALPAPPIAQRTFPQNDEIALFAEVYDSSNGVPHKVDILSTVTTDEGTVLFKNEETRDSSELQGATGGYGYAARIPLSELQPGMYVLRVEGRSRLGDRQVAGREVQFQVVPPVNAAGR